MLADPEDCDDGWVVVAWVVAWRDNDDDDTALFADAAMCSPQHVLDSESQPIAHMKQKGLPHTLYPSSLA